MSIAHEREWNNASQSPSPSRGERQPPRSSCNARLLHDLDRQLRSERGPDGEPSTSDFQTFELLDIVEKFAVDFDGLPALIPEREDYRILISTGIVVRADTVVGQLSNDGAVELISLDLDLDTDQNWS